ncbi:MAG: oligoendopeptidase F [Eubacteriaceae bacterium]|nr:oligoendopeptidase F [Eubacteriaceae bacterium]
MSKKLKQRNEIDDKYKWDLESMYADEKDWESDLAACGETAKELAGYKGKIGENAENLLAVMSLHDKLERTGENVIVYAMMRRDEDNRREKYQAMCDKAMSVFTQLAAATSFITPELLSCSEDTVMSFIDAEPALEIYRFFIKDMFREKDHVLSKEEENIIAQFGEITPAAGDVFKMLNDADMKFGTVTDEDGEEVELTHGNYIKFLESHDRSVRKQAYEGCYKAYRALINTLAAAYNYSVKGDCLHARMRKYDSARQCALSGGNIPETVYDSLVSAVNDELPTLHKYIELRKKMLGVDELSMYDVYVPLIEIPKRVIPYAEALEIVEEALQPMGEEYIARMKKGFADGWIDVYENEGKTSGAYSFGSYDSKPFILCNYADTLQDVFTVIHEMGHSMNSLYTREAQPFIYGSHSIFTAEVASTVNENLLMKYLLKKEKDPEMRKYLINMHIEAFRTTLFRQTMFAEFELYSHRTVEEGGQLTAAGMCEEYKKLNYKYFGRALADDEYIQYEWARIPHFYSAFYVYQYATGYSAAAAISDSILSDYEKNSKPGKATEAYIEFLKSGDNDYPIELLKIAGVDMSTTGPVNNAMKVFAELVDEFCGLNEQ